MRDTAASAAAPAARCRNCRRGSFILTLPLRLRVRAPRQAHGEHRAFAVLARNRHVTAHQARELTGDGKAEAGSAEALSGRGIGLAELLEQLCLSPPRRAGR